VLGVPGGALGPFTEQQAEQCVRRLIEQEPQDPDPGG